ncbi:MAG: AAA family ATPase [Desulfobulbaceae bacterium]|nr:AAA family ATPase [Desulfobulbaceae bacterium]
MMYLEHFHLTQSPFQEEPNPEILFPGAKREDICQSLLLDVLAGKPLVKLIGREGSGKTLLCRVIIDRLPSNYEVVYIDNPVGAFDDLLRLACLDLGMNPIGQHEATNFLQELRRLLELQKAANKKIVLIIDEAEKLFLATLERLVRHVSDYQDDLGLTIILAGRPGLDANLEQLAVFSAEVDMHSGYYLEALNENETRQYLRFRLTAAGLSREQHGDIFTEGAVAKIFDSAQGNLRMINILAEEALQVSCSEKSFMVLLDHVEPEEDDGDAMESKVLEIYEMLRHNRFLTAGLSLAVVLVLVIGFMLSGKGGKEPQVPTASEKTIKVLPQTAVESQAPAVPAGQVGSAGPSAEVPLAVPAPTKESERRDGEKLFRERLGAGAGLLAGSLRGGYTIQLMVLASDQAQASITKTLVQDEYYPLKDQFYILRKKSNPPSLFVFYGIFDNMDAAREARNTMPVLLRKHHPYPLSISEALKKLEN